MTDKDTLSPKEARVLEALLSSPTVAKAAKAAKVSRTTVYALLDKPEFAEEYRSRCMQALDLAQGRIRALAGEALDVIVDVMRDKEEKAPIRMAAASKILDVAMRGLDVGDGKKKPGEEPSDEDWVPVFRDADPEKDKR